MIDLVQHGLIVFAAFFAIMNPISNTTVFIALTSDEDRGSQKKIAFKALLLTFSLIALFAVFGKAIFHLFGISLYAFRITGGILVFFIGYNMLQGQSSKMHSDQNSQKTDIAVSPLAVPLLAGPGTIATAMNYSADVGNGAIIVTVSMFALLCVITYFSFVFGQKMVNKIGADGLNIITRLMGLILAVVGMEMLIAGIDGAVSAYASSV